MSILRLTFPVLGLGMLVSACVPPPTPGVVVSGAVQAYASNNCYAGFYQCLLPTVQQAGTPCACPGLGAPSFGTVR